MPHWSSATFGQTWALLKFCFVRPHNKPIDIQLFVLSDLMAVRLAVYIAAFLGILFFIFLSEQLEVH